MKKLLFILLLSGCATQNNPLAQYTEADAKAAITLAKANNDTPAVTCYTAILTAVQAMGSTQGEGILYANEALRIATVQGAVVKSACVGLL